MFLHSGFLHLAGICFSFWIFGDNVEDTFGHLPYLFFYWSAGSARDCFTCFSISARRFRPSVQAERFRGHGRVHVLYLEKRILTLVFIFVVPIPAVFILGYWFLLQFLAGIDALGTWRTRGASPYGRTSEDSCWSALDANWCAAGRRLSRTELYLKYYFNFDSTRSTSQSPTACFAFRRRDRVSHSSLECCAHGLAKRRGLRFQPRNSSIMGRRLERSRADWRFPFRRCSARSHVPARTAKFFRVDVAGRGEAEAARELCAQVADDVAKRLQSPMTSNCRDRERFHRQCIDVEMPRVELCEPWRTSLKTRCHRSWAKVMALDLSLMHTRFRPFRRAYSKA